MKSFYAVVANALIASLASTFVWFAVTFWAYLETRSVIATSIMAGIFLATTAISGIFLGSLVDRFSKKTALILSVCGSLVMFSGALLVLLASPPEAFRSVANPAFWAFVALVLFGALMGNMRGIALSTLVTILVPEGERDRANGLVGTANGVSFLVASIFSGLGVGFLGIVWVVGITLIVSSASLLHLLTLRINEPRAAHHEAADASRSIDLRGTIAVVLAVPGLAGLILFNTFNNLLGGVFISLMDAYGLQLMSVQAWGILWGFLSLGFIIGGMGVARWGLGASPLRTMFLANIVIWLISTFFTIQSSVLLLAIGSLFYLALIPVIEAAEQTILQRAIPLERQGRVFGFAQSIEQAASPLMAFLIGPVAQIFFIPFMTDGAGAQLIGGWFGTGIDRGIALVFVVTGIIGLCMTLLAMQSSAYRLLSRHTTAPASSEPSAAIG